MCVEQTSGAARSELQSLVTTTDLALLATLMNDAICHLMNAIDKASRVREPIDRIADAMEQTAAAVKTAIAAQPSPYLAFSRNHRRLASV